MNSFIFISILLGLGLAARSRFVPAAHYRPLLGSSGLAGVRDCGKNDEVLKILSMYISKCDEAPCGFSVQEVYHIFVEFKLHGNFTTLSNTITASALGFSIPILELNTCNILIVGKCPFVEGEIYVAAVDVDPSKLIPDVFRPFLKSLGRISGDIEITAQNPEKTKQMCASFPLSLY